ncbi:hypothetical protein [Bacillus sp. FJAT-27251]|uniref:hypothetical protein n=1 Tax=Bacillus sp. FJAT-27251 TaxID=1684142 RepID=UPI0006A7DA54|nr:hypothetical protein [Bacillus sp. FJAT-27251]
MDTVPFFEFNHLELRDTAIVELSKFRKTNFDIESIFKAASELRYTSEIKQYLAHQLETPSDEFISLLISGIYNVTRNVLDKFQGIVRRSLKQFVNNR